jgi:hypothetical protein
MPTLYVNSGAGGSNNGTDWTNAYLKLASAAAAVTAGDLIKVHNAHAEAYSAAETIPFAAACSVICVDKDNSDALSTGAVCGSQTGNFALTVTGAHRVFFHGITFRNGNTGGSGGAMIQFSTDGAQYTFSECSFVSVGTGSGAYAVLTPGAGGGVSCWMAFSKCTFTGLAQIRAGVVEWDDCSVTSTFQFGNSSSGGGNGPATFRANGCNFSDVGSGTLILNPSTNGGISYTFTNCRMHTGTIQATQTDGKHQNSVWLFNCSSGDNHYVLAHYDALGSTTISPTIYANDGAKYDGTNGCSWVVASTAYASFTHPYVSPWIDKYHAGASAITPRLECFRDGSTTIYDNTQVWSELSYQGTSGSTKAEIVSNRATPLASGSTTGRTSTLTHASWETGTSADVAFKLDHGAITPAEIGHLRMRICVGATNVTDLYVDGKIRL